MSRACTGARSRFATSLLSSLGFSCVGKEQDSVTRKLISQKKSGHGTSVTLENKQAAANWSRVTHGALPSSRTWRKLFLSFSFLHLALFSKMWGARSIRCLWRHSHSWCGRGREGRAGASTQKPSCTQPSLFFGVFFPNLKNPNHCLRSLVPVFPDQLGTKSWCK